MNKGGAHPCSYARPFGETIMNRFAVILAIVILPAWALPAPADGIFGLFSKKPRPNPAERVPQLIVTLKTDQDERKRSAAATELGSFDANAFSEIVPVLVDALQHDPKAGVRMDAASSLGGIRPVSRLAGDALEKAVSGDNNWRVRWHTKGILLRYRIAGYTHESRGTSPAATGPSTSEPPLLDQAPRQFPMRLVPGSPASMSRVPTITNRADDTPEFRPSIPRPLPVGPVFSTAVPQNTREAPPATRPPESTDGPPLTPTPPAPF